MELCLMPNMMRISDQSQVETSPDWDVEVFFDADCPLCRREIAWLRKLDRRARVRFTNIADPQFDPKSLGISYDRLMDQIHARLPDGRWVQGVEVFRRIYSALGFGFIVAPTRWPGISWLLDRAYQVFARNRLRWTGRCTKACEIPPKAEAGDAA
ncbi:thiol-disulfide oxidoreductase DCC family protein [Singulisphaera sp. PoT]|uniref:thiol-disulfide oxidoreductase DCC family protein n=1 Tax=Singulisphaera sp. PoT TaxID=3411797 RepID=UPI003BF5101D